MPRFGAWTLAPLRFLISQSNEMQRQVQTEIPVCVCCAGSAQFCRRQHCTLGGYIMEHGVGGKTSPLSPVQATILIKLFNSITRRPIEL